MVKRILGLGMVLALMGTLVVPVLAVPGLEHTVVLAANSGNQTASTSMATTIAIVSKTSDNAVATITFPPALPSSVVSVPYNDQEGSGDPQFLDSSNSEPVVRLKNTSGGTLNIWLSITAWTNNAVASERYKLMDTTTTNVTSLASGNTLTTTNTATSTNISAGAYKALYLEVTLGDVAAKSGSSTITVLGES